MVPIFVTNHVWLLPHYAPIGGSDSALWWGHAEAGSTARI